jgi:hypothetical protein
VHLRRLDLLEAELVEVPHLPGDPLHDRPRVLDGVEGLRVRDDLAHRHPA